jgi:hypothetical protein
LDNRRDELRLVAPGNKEPAAHLQDLAGAAGQRADHRAPLSEIVICSGPKTVLDRLVQIVADLGPLGGVLMAKTEWDEPALYRRSYRLLAEEVRPKLRAHVAPLPLAAE